jgi:hypothetical protein
MRRTSWGNYLYHDFADFKHKNQFRTGFQISPPNSMGRHTVGDVHGSALTHLGFFDI